MNIWVDRDVLKVMAKTHLNEIYQIFSIDVNDLGYGGFKREIMIRIFKE